MASAQDTEPGVARIDHTYQETSTDTAVQLPDKPPEVVDIPAHKADSIAVDTVAGKMTDTAGKFVALSPRLKQNSH